MKKLRNAIKIQLSIQCLGNIIQKKANAKTLNPGRVSVRELKIRRVNLFSALPSLGSLLKSLFARVMLVNGLEETVETTPRFQSAVMEKLKQHMGMCGNLKNKLWLRDRRKT